jgi:hypothetical protein
MKALVVYESVFGNTEAIARAVAEGMATVLDVTVADARTFPPAGDVEILVAGAPTHAFSLSRRSTRADAAKQHGARPGTVETGLRDYLDCLPRLTGVWAATFDTKIAKPMLPGSAARKAYRRLQNLGCRMLAGAESFHVVGTTGPLSDGERERARHWGALLAVAALQGRHHHASPA